MTTRTVVVRFLALHVRCAACGAIARIPPDCDLYATWADSHCQPGLVRAEVEVDGVHGYRPIWKD